MKALDIMLDLETLDNRPTSVILSLAATPFDFESDKEYPALTQYINVDSCLNAGLTVCQNTILWWLDQSEEARNKQTSADRVSLVAALQNLSQFIDNLRRHYSTIDDNDRLHTPQIYLWGNGAAFDLAILRNAYAACGLEFPIKPWFEQDVRTITRFAPSIKKNMEFVGVQHDAEYDCRHQIKCVKETMKVKNMQHD